MVDDKGSTEREESNTPLIAAGFVVIFTIFGWVGLTKIEQVRTSYAIQQDKNRVNDTCAAMANTVFSSGLIKHYDDLEYEITYAINGENHVLIYQEGEEEEFLVELNTLIDHVVEDKKLERRPAAKPVIVKRIKSTPVAESLSLIEKVYGQSMFRCSAEGLNSFPYLHGEQD